MLFVTSGDAYGHFDPEDTVRNKTFRLDYP